MKRLLILIGAVVFGMIMGAGSMAISTTSRSHPDCVTLKISYSDDIAAGIKHVKGEDFNTTWATDAVICLGTPGPVGGSEFGGTWFIELVESK